MKYLVFFIALAVGAQSFPPSSSPVKRPPCSATVTDNCTPQTVGGATYGVAGGSGSGDVLGAAAVQSGRVPYGSGTTGTLTSSSKMAYNDTTGMGLIPPLSLGQNGTAAGRINLLGSTSGSYPIEVNADGTSITFTGAAVFTGPITAGASGPLDLTAIAAPSTPAAGIGSVYVDITSKNLAVKDDAGVVKHGVQTKAAASNQVLRAIADDGTVTQSALAAADIPATPLITPGTSITLTGPRAYAVCTGTCTVAVPAPVAGYEFCVMNDNNVATAITLSALGSSAMYENSARTAYGTAGTGTLVLSAAAANRVCIVGRDSTHYLTVSYNGTVTVN